MRSRAAALVLAAYVAGFANSANAFDFSKIPGWSEDDQAQAWPVFHQSCIRVAKNKSSSLSLRAVCEKALALPENLPRQRAINFFEMHFTPFKLTEQERGLMTGYYEPEVRASKKQSVEFSMPILRRPKDLVSEVSPPGHPELKAAQKLPNGTLVPYPDRTQIEAGALKQQDLELFWVSDAFDLFTMQMQGSSRLKFEDGSILRIAYDGKNGQPYTPIGKILLERGLLPKGGVSMQAIGDVFKKDPELAREIMRKNKSYVFFRVLEAHDAAKGPLGAQGLPLTPFRSLAVDSDIHDYGLPFFIDGTLPGNEKTFRHLAIAQDTGTAITGKARIDLFTGWGEEAAALAGQMQQRVDVYLLRSKD